MKKQLIIVLFMWFGITSAMEDSGVLTNSWVTVPKAENQQDDDNEPSSFSSSSGYASAESSSQPTTFLDDHLDTVRSLRRSVDNFERNLFAEFQQASDAAYIEFPDSIQEISTHIMSLYDFINHGKNSRLQIGQQCATHNEMIALFNLAVEKLNKIVCILTMPACSDNEMRKAKVSGAKLTETLHLFFGLIENNASAYELCDKKYLISKVLKRVIKKPENIDDIAERLYSCWQGRDSMVERYQHHMYPRIDKCAQAMERIYDRVGVEDQELSEHVERLKKEINDVHFSIYQNFRQYLKYADLLKKASEGQDLLSDEGNDYRAAQILERNIQEDTVQEAFLESQRKRLIQERDNLYHTIFGLVPEECLNQETERGSSSSSVTLSQLLKNAINVDIVRNFVSDLQGELVLKSGKRAYLMADISDRLQTGDRVHGLTNQATKLLYGKLLHFLYRGIECGYQHASTVSKVQEQLQTVSEFTHDLPVHYENYGAGIVRVAQMTKNSVDWTKYIFTAPVRAVAAPFRYFGSFWSSQEQPDDTDPGKDGVDTHNEKETEEVKNASTRVRKVVVCALSKDGGQTIDRIKKIVAQMVNPASQFAEVYRREIISINALAHMFECLSDPRTRNIGTGEFRKRFDQCANAWNTGEDLDLQQSETSDSSVEEGGLRRRR